MREGFEPDRIHQCEDVAQAIEAVRELIRPGDLVLVKASRVARLERLAGALRSSIGGERDVAAGAASGASA
jgi:UDP-N-acetylmuramoyl-tripeptide--D-alanyl-D-alanine ligase